MFRSLVIAFLTASATLAAGAAAAAVIDPSSPTSSWTAVFYPSTPDPTGDQGTGDKEGDIVGDTSHAALYTTFDDAGTPSATDGNLAFRVRLSGDSNPPGWENFVVVGLDAGEDALNDIDIYLGVDGQGSGDNLGIYDPGAGGNTSPSTTTLTSVPSLSWALTATNFDWSPVDGSIDPGVTNTDFGADGNDFFLSFLVPFDDIVAELLADGIGVDETTAFRYVLGTGNQPNALNQDVGASSGSWSDTTTWDALGALSSPLAPVPVPEPSPLSLALLGLILLSAGARRQRR
jgi:hypothetical protein